jgi:hypothetical protein
MKEAKKTEVIVGIEPTGYYWMNLAYLLDHYGIPLLAKADLTLDLEIRTSYRAMGTIGTNQTP